MLPSSQKTMSTGSTNQTSSEDSKNSRSNVPAAPTATFWQRQCSLLQQLELSDEVQGGMGWWWWGNFLVMGGVDFIRVPAGGCTAWCVLGSPSCLPACRPTPGGSGGAAAGYGVPTPQQDSRTAGDGLGASGAAASGAQWARTCSTQRSNLQGPTTELEESRMWLCFCSANELRGTAAESACPVQCTVHIRRHCMQWKSVTVNVQLLLA